MLSEKSELGDEYLPSLSVFGQLDHQWRVLVNAR
jgi:hypothetical protein